ncbi:hypothetical protein ACIBK9_51395 [Nonomuraea sp. NPDC050227]|uniref:hypothetical protein n=1 Tax=Nonomuraea sp. NPDC050227 TaxID=3364360 RepID=UPI00379295DD
MSEIEGPSLAELERELPSRHLDVLSINGILPPAGGRAVAVAFKRLRPQYSDLVDTLSKPLGINLSSGARGELLGLERDAVGVLLDIARVDRRILRSWQEPAGDASSFLTGLPQNIATEDALISHDLERFSIWTQLPSNRVEWRIFSDGNRRVFIMNANRTAVENNMGVDLVYLNELHKAFILVQYKKMRNEAHGTGKNLIYRPDHNLEDELNRMREVDRVAESAQGDFRLFAPPCWLKLCEPTSRIEDPRELIRGMYLPREHFESLLVSRIGPRGGKGIGYGNVKEYLNNTTFVDLVRSGLIGSRATGTDEIMRVIDESLSSGHAVTLGVDAGVR